MSEDREERPGVVIDVTPEPEGDTAATADASPPDTDAPTASGGEPPAAARGQRTALVVAVLALALVLGALAFAWQYSRQAVDDLARLDRSLAQALEQQRALAAQLDAARQAVAEQAARIDAQQQAIDAQRTRIEAAGEAFEQQNRRLDEEREQMARREAELRAAVADVHKRVGASGTQWMIAEAEYLLRLAGERLALARDPGTARAALELADQRLRDTGDPGWGPVREQIARDIAALDGAALPDIDGISARLAALAEQVPRLRLARTTLGGGPRRPPEGGAEATPREQRTWQTLLDDLWAGFKQTVRIRRNDQPVQAMLPPEQQFFLYENLRLHLEAARLAAVRGDEPLYHDHLKTVARWLDTHFDPADPQTRALREAVRELDAVRIRPALPDIGGSLAALQARRRLLADLGRPLVPEAPAGGEETPAEGAAR